MNRQLAHPARTLLALVASPVLLLSAYITWLAVPDIVAVVVAIVVNSIGVRFA
jgi:hypothetical protein